MSTAPLPDSELFGIFGDRLSAAREMVHGGSIDVLTGDWLAELTMGVLVKQRKRNADTGFARTFVQQLDEVLETCLDRKIKIVSNAGGPQPARLRRADRRHRRTPRPDGTGGRRRR